MKADLACDCTLAIVIPEATDQQASDLRKTQRLNLVLHLTGEGIFGLRELSLQFDQG